MSKRKLLLADDSVTIQKVVNLTFADEGIEVITAGDGNIAMEKLREAAPDLVMADVNMPGLNGYQICEQIKLNETTRKTPVILLVGSFEPFDEAKANAVGADDFLTKPFQSIRQLVNKVNDLLSANSGEDESFAETLEMEKPELFAQAGFGDESDDDDLIETNHIDNYSSFDMPVFNGRTNAPERDIAQNSENALEIADESPVTEFALLPERDDYREAEEQIERSEKRYLENFEHTYEELNLEPEETEEEPFLSAPPEVSAEPEAVSNLDDNFNNETHFSSPDMTNSIEKTETFSQESEPETAAGIGDGETIAPTAQTERVSQPTTAAAPELDEFDLLDLPSFDEEQPEAQEAQETQETQETPEPEEENIAENESPVEPTEPETVQAVEPETDVRTEAVKQISAVDFPPEVIEAIADKVVEKLSQRLKP